ncbi:hypothetical protein UlMin_016644 [Ulmus minor]
MGVPSFYKWLVGKYPKVVGNAIEERGEKVDSSLPNPNGFEFDNLYLDMNGIIHPCFHPEDDNGISSPSTFEEVFNSIFDYIDRLFSIVRPRKLLYLAIDGVAPRAKMNQQRSRRFRTAKDKELEEEEEEIVRKQFELEGKHVLPKQESEVLDSNVITPGTEFMFKLSKVLKSYVSSRLSSDLGWKNIKVILSDANVPGEGEHKIMSFIRGQRALPSYDPNTRHCLHGLDADLIMLALATHELHFSILREDVLNQVQNFSNFKPNLDSRLSTAESSPKSREWLPNESNLGAREDANLPITMKPLQFLHVWILREYLELDMQIPDPPENFKSDLDRIVDDFIFMCFFVGNDFLPHTPSLEIHEGALDLLMSVYKKEFKNLGGYLIDMSRVEDKKFGYIKLSRVEKFIILVGSFEDKIFRKRSDLRDRRLKRLCSDSDAVEEEDNETVALQPMENNKLCDYPELLRNTKELREKVKANLRKDSDLFKKGGLVDKIRLGSTGCKVRYYKEKFCCAGIGDNIDRMKKDVVAKYTEGLFWVLLYYFSGPPSWTWYYPYHFGPFVSDLKGLSQVKIRFKKGSPFKPFDQLMAVLPPRSAHALPKTYQALMYEDSSIVDLYPRDFEIDMEGKRFTWQGICKLPFIDEERILSETRKLEKDLQGLENERNMQGPDELLFLSAHKLGSLVWSLSKDKKEIKKAIDLSDEIGGFIWLSLEFTAIDGDFNGPTHEDSVLCVLYELPDSSPHIPCLLPGLNFPPRTIDESDIEETQLWHDYPGAKPPANRCFVRESFKNISISGYRAPTNGDSWHRGACRGNQRPQDYVSPIQETNIGSWNGGLDNKAKNESTYEPVYQGIGSGPGWGAGRGKPDRGNDSRALLNYPSRRTNSASNSAYFYREAGQNHYQEQRTLCSSPTSARPNSGGFQPVQTSFWPTQQNNQSWHQSSNFNCNFGRGRGRGQQGSAIFGAETWQETAGSASIPISYAQAANRGQNTAPGVFQPGQRSFRPTQQSNQSWHQSSNFNSNVGRGRGRAQQGSASFGAETWQETSGQTSSWPTPQNNQSWQQSSNFNNVGRGRGRGSRGRNTAPGHYS